MPVRRISIQVSIVVRKHEEIRCLAWKRYVFRWRKPHENAKVYTDGDGELYISKACPKANHH
jgi:hypothetical protein